MFIIQYFETSGGSLLWWRERSWVRRRLPCIVCQTVIIKEQVLTFWRAARVCVRVCACVCRCACTLILGATVCMCYLYVNIFTLLEFVHANLHYFCGMLFISVFICGAFISPSHLSASGSPRLSVKDIAHRRIHHAVAQPNSHTGCCFFF